MPISDENFAVTRRSILLVSSLLFLIWSTGGGTALAVPLLKQAGSHADIYLDGGRVTLLLAVLNSYLIIVLFIGRHTIRHEHDLRWTVGISAYNETLNGIVEQLKKFHGTFGYTNYLNDAMYQDLANRFEGCTTAMIEANQLHKALSPWFENFQKATEEIKTLATQIRNACTSPDGHARPPSAAQTEQLGEKIDAWEAMINSGIAALAAKKQFDHQDGRTWHADNRLEEAKDLYASIGNMMGQLATQARIIRDLDIEGLAAKAIAVLPTARQSERFRMEWLNIRLPISLGIFSTCMALFPYVRSYFWP